MANAWLSESKGVVLKGIVMRQRYIRELPWEAIIWIAGVAIVAFLDPTIERSWSLCFFERLGIVGENGLLSICPGCGLGHAVAYLFRGEFLLSMEAHLLGIPAVVVLLGRSISLFMIYSTSTIKDR